MELTALVVWASLQRCMTSARLQKTFHYRDLCLPMRAFASSEIGIGNRMGRGGTSPRNPYQNGSRSRHGPRLTFPVDLRRGRFPRIARAALSLKAASCLIDGEAVACDDNGLPVFDRLRYRREDWRVFLYAFDLIELDGDDLRREPIDRRRVLLIRLLAKTSVGLQVNDHIVEPGDVVFRHACQLGFEGIVSKRL